MFGILEGLEASGAPIVIAGPECAFVYIGADLMSENAHFA